MFNIILTALRWFFTRDPEQLGVLIVLLGHQLPYRSNAKGMVQCFEQIARDKPDRLTTYAELEDTETHLVPYDPY